MHLLVTALLALATTSPAEVNVVSRVAVRDAGAALEVTIEGARPLTFSTYSTQDPPGFVVDLPDTSLAGVPEAQQPDGSAVREIRAEQRPVDGLAQSRVSLAFAPGVEPPRVAADGNSIVITVAKPPAPVAPVVAADAPREPTPAVAQAAPAAAPAAVTPVTPVEAPAAVAAAPAEASAPAPALAQAPALPRPPPQPVEELPDELFTSAPPAAVPTAPVAALAAPPPVASAPARPRRAAPTLLREVGFQLLEDGSRVFVRLTGTPRFAVREPNAAVVLVELEETRAQRDNDLRPLDTSFFPTAVLRVTPRRQGTSTVLEIQLREPVAWRQRVDGDVLAIDFDPPAEPSSSPAPADPSGPAALR